MATTKLSPYYAVDLKINGINFGLSVSSIRYINSIKQVYPTFIITFSVNQSDAAEFNMFMQLDNVILTIHELVEPSDTPRDSYELELLCLKSFVKTNYNEYDNSKWLDPDSKVILVCIPKQQFLNMTKSVNILAENTDSNKTVFDVVTLW